jgi:hypothetical protein
MIVGNATANAKLQAFSQIFTIFGTKPTLKTLMTNDIIHDISNAIKKENTYL